MRHPRTLIDAVVRCYGNMPASEVAVQYAMTRSAVCGIWERAKREGVIRAGVASSPAPDAVPGVERPFIKFQVYADTFAAFQRMASKEKCESVSQWVRRVVEKAAQEATEQIRAERLAAAAADAKSDLNKVKSLLARKYSPQGIAAQTRLPYRQVQRLIKEVQQCA